MDKSKVMPKIAYKDLIMMVLGLTLMSFGYAAFLLPENIVTGGVAGISSIISLHRITVSMWLSPTT